MFLRRVVQQALRKQSNVRMTCIRAFGSGHDHHDEHHADHHHHDASVWVEHPVNFVGRTIPNNNISDAIGFDGTQDFRFTIGPYGEYFAYAASIVVMSYLASKVINQPTAVDVKAVEDKEAYIDSVENFILDCIENYEAPETHARYAPHQGEAYFRSHPEVLVPRREL